mmetsp:Transcript_9494/g.41563  ORF Transcript_9494/g.41563 Transcript_9494/m.41563 type:complete len:244 (+) Transcript_9494:583-1314(+)
MSSSDCPSDVKSSRETSSGSTGSSSTCCRRTRWSPRRRGSCAPTRVAAKTRLDRRRSTRRAAGRFAPRSPQSSATRRRARCWRCARTWARDAARGSQGWCPRRPPGAAEAPATGSFSSSTVDRWTFPKPRGCATRRTGSTIRRRRGRRSRASCSTFGSPRTRTTSTSRRISARFCCTASRKCWRVSARRWKRSGPRAGTRTRWPRRGPRTVPRRRETTRSELGTRSRADRARRPRRFFRLWRG